jgi:hypothetical protein
MPPASSQPEAGAVVITRRDAYASKAANGYKIPFLSLRVAVVLVAFWFILGLPD